MWRNKDEAGNKSSAGFTLLELLVAMGLLAVLSAALYGTYFSLMRGHEKATAGMEERRELRDTLDMLRVELTSARYDGKNKLLHFIVEDRDYFGKPASILSFTTTVGTSELPLSDQVAVKYRPVEKEGNILLAKQTRDVYIGGEQVLIPQMEKLEGFLVECTADGTKWDRTWNSSVSTTTPTLNPVLPKAVRVTIRVKEGEKTVEFSTIASPRMK